MSTDTDIARIAEGLTANEHACIMAYDRGDGGVLFESVYEERGGNIEAAYVADLLRVNAGAGALWHRERRRTYSLLQLYRLTPFGLRVRQYLEQLND